MLRNTISLFRPLFHTTVLCVCVCVCVLRLQIGAAEFHIDEGVTLIPVHARRCARQVRCTTGKPWTTDSKSSPAALVQTTKWPEKIKKRKACFCKTTEKLKMNTLIRKDALVSTNKLKMSQYRNMPGKFQCFHTWSNRHLKMSMRYRNVNCRAFYPVDCAGGKREA